MKVRDGRSALLVGLFVAFVCLLISGFPRLIARTQEPCALPDPATMRAAMIGAPAAQTGGETGTSEMAATMPRAERPKSCAMRLVGERALALRCDANGNVLGHRSYLHTVYRAFALGDGFV